MSRRKSRRAAALAIQELAVDPADVDRETYPVWIRLNRPLSDSEATALSQLDPALRTEGNAVVVPDAKLDDIAHDHAQWKVRLENVERIGEERDGEGLMADQRRAERLSTDAPNLQSQTARDRGLH